MPIRPVAPGSLQALLQASQFTPPTPGAWKANFPRFPAPPQPSVKAEETGTGPIIQKALAGGGQGAMMGASMGAGGGLGTAGAAAQASPVAAGAGQSAIGPAATGGAAMAGAPAGSGVGSGMAVGGGGASYYNPQAPMEAMPAMVGQASPAQAQSLRAMAQDPSLTTAEANDLSPAGHAYLDAQEKPLSERMGAYLNPFSDTPSGFVAPERDKAFNNPSVSSPGSSPTDAKMQQFFKMLQQLRASGAMR